jgi:hypothetical protein
MRRSSPDSHTPRQNRLLAALPVDELERLRPNLQLTEMPPSLRGPAVVPLAAAPPAGLVDLLDDDPTVRVHEHVIAIAVLA